jgi:hypothetical protein
MAKVLTKFAFTDSRARINYDETWFGGSIVELNETDLGPFTESGPAGKVQSLKKHAKEHYGMGLRTQVTEKNTLVIQAYKLSEAAK